MIMSAISWKRYLTLTLTWTLVFVAIFALVFLSSSLILDPSELYFVASSNRPNEKRSFSLIKYYFDQRCCCCARKSSFMMLIFIVLYHACTLTTIQSQGSVCLNFKEDLFGSQISPSETYLRKNLGLYVERNEWSRGCLSTDIFLQ